MRSVATRAFTRTIAPRLRLFLAYLPAHRYAIPTGTSSTCRSQRMARPRSRRQNRTSSPRSACLKTSSECRARLEFAQGAYRKTSEVPKSAGVGLHSGPPNCSAVACTECSRFASRTSTQNRLGAMTSCVTTSGTQWHPAPKVSSCAKNHGRRLLILNGTDRSRTDDLLRVKQALFQLSYDPATSGPQFTSTELLCGRRLRLARVFQSQLEPALGRRNLIRSFSAPMPAEPFPAALEAHDFESRGPILPAIMKVVCNTLKTNKISH